MAFNRKAKLRDNIEAIRTVFELGKAGRAATPEKRANASLWGGGAPPATAASAG